MNLNVSHTFLSVNDQDQALAFYRDVLGLEVHTDVQLESMRWLTVSPKNQQLEICLLPPGSPMNTQADIDAAKELTAKGLMPGIIFTVESCDALFEKLTAAGAEVTQEPIDQPYGVRDCGFRDPSGNHLRFSEIKTA